MIKLEHVSKSYAAGIPALNDVNLEIEDGEFVFVVGDSGSGKSTLIKLLLKELEPTEGTILVDGKKLGSVKHKQIPKYRRNIGVVFQDFRLLKDRNVYDNVAFAQRVVGASSRSIRQKVPMMLSMVGLAAKYRSFPRQLSGGEQQRVAIARALVSKPEILILDDSLSALDFATDAALRKAIGELEGNVTTFLVSQRISGIRQADKILVLDDGELVGVGTHKELMESCKVYREICLSQLSEQEVNR